jgi:hypothetical protein
VRKVKWQYRDGRDGEFSKHYHGDYVVTVQDMDGDGTEWEVWLSADLEKARKEREAGNERAYADPIAKGYVCVRAIEDFRIGQAVAIEALDGIFRARSELERERTAQRRNPVHTTEKQNDRLGSRPLGQ